MPCFTRKRSTVNFKAEHFDLLEEALRILRYPILRERGTVSFYAPHGRITIRDGNIDMDQRDRDIINKVKVQYGRLIIKSLAARHGWVLFETSKNRFLARKRSPQFKIN